MTAKFYSQEKVCTYVTKTGIALVFVNGELECPDAYVEELKTVAGDPASPISADAPVAADTSVAEAIKADAATKALEEQRAKAK